MNTEYFRSISNEKVHSELEVFNTLMDQLDETLDDLHDLISGYHRLIDDGTLRLFLKSTLKKSSAIRSFPLCGYRIPNFL